MKFTGGSGRLFNFNWWKFTPIATGTTESVNSSVECVNDIIVISDATNTQTIQLKLSPAYLNGNLSVCLFDMTGRLVTKLFTGRSLLSLQIITLDRTKIRTGAYVVKMSMDNKIVLTKPLLIQ
jgi:hypothetical protein